MATAAWCTGGTGGAAVAGVAADFTAVAGIIAEKK